MTTVIQPAPPAVRRPDRALAVIVACQLMIGLDSTVVTVALPHMRAGLGFSATGLSWVQNGYMLAFGGLLLLGGRAGDLFGRRRALIAGVSVFVLASLLGGLALAPWQLVAARVLQGVGAALAGPSTMALIATIFTGAARVRALSLYSAVVGAGGAAGLVLGGLLTDAASWRWVMFVNVPIGLLVLAGAPRLLPETPRRDVRFDVPGAALSTGGALALVYGFLAAADRGWADPATLGAFALAAALLAAFALSQRRAPQPVLPPWLLRDRTRAFAFANMLLLPSAMFGMFFFTTQYLQEVLGYGPMRAGLAFLPTALTQFAFVRLVPRLLPRFGARRVMIVGAALVTAGLFWLSRLAEGDGYAAGLLGPLVLLGLGGAFSIMPLNVTVLREVPPQDSGAVSGVAQSALWLGGAFGSAVLVSVYGSATGGRTDLHSLVGGMADAFTVATLAFCLPALLIASFVLRPAR